MTAKPRHDWFQSDADVVVSIMKRNVPLEQCHAEISSENVLIVRQTATPGDDVTLFEGHLFSGVKKDDVTVKCTPAKIEVRMPKLARGERWTSLLADGSGAPQGAPTTPFPSASDSASAPRPAAAKKDWDAIEKQAVKEEEDEKLEGDAAVNKMFRKIYEDAPEDVRRAMMKSYSESGGTVLSTNWAEISQKKTEVQPPACMEYKQFAK